MASTIISKSNCLFKQHYLHKHLDAKKQGLLIQFDTVQNTWFKHLPMIVFCLLNCARNCFVLFCFECVTLMVNLVNSMQKKETGL